MIILVTGMTVAYDLAIAVVVGVIVSALVYAWKSAHKIWVTERPSERPDQKIYELRGPLFFGSIAKFKDLFHPRNDQETDVVIDFRYARVWDHSALEAIDALAVKYKEAGKRLHLIHLSKDCQFLLDNAKDLVEANVTEDPHYGVVTDYAEALKKRNY